MSTAQITKWRENATTDKFNVNPPLIHEEVRQIFRWLEVVRSLPPSRLKIRPRRSESECSPHPPG